MKSEHHKVQPSGNGAAIDLSELEALVERATPGPWMVQDGCSWRRIGTHMHDGDVLRPTNQRDGHPDFGADDGKMNANLALIVAAVNALPHLISTIRSQEAEILRLTEEGSYLSAGACINPGQHGLVGDERGNAICTAHVALLKAEAERDALRAALVEAREALEPFAKIKIGAIDVGQTITMLEDDDTVRAPMKVRDIRRAALAISKLEGGE